MPSKWLQNFTFCFLKGLLRTKHFDEIKKNRLTDKRQADKSQSHDELCLSRIESGQSIKRGMVGSMKDRGISRHFSYMCPLSSLKANSASDAA